jgi:hypothetical protein
MFLFSKVDAMANLHMDMKTQSSPVTQIDQAVYIPNLPYRWSSSQQITRNIIALDLDV